MDAKLCDRCGAVVKDGDCFYIVSIQRKGRDAEYARLDRVLDSPLSKTIDLCPKCAGELMTWTKGFNNF